MSSTVDSMIGVKIGAAHRVVAAVRSAQPPQFTVLDAAATGPDVVRVVGDPVPIVEDDGATVFPEVLFVESLIDTLRAAGDPRGDITIVHPDTWTPFALDSVRRVLDDLDDSVTGSDLRAARLLGETVALLADDPPAAPTVIYDLGASGLTISVVGPGADGGVQLLGRAGHSTSVSGDEFDHRVLTHVLTVTGAVDALDPARIDEPDVVTALAELRRHCRAARETLSADTSAQIPIALPGVATHSRIVRAELEQLLREPLETSLQLVRATVAVAGLTPADISRIIVTGGAAATPLVSELLSASWPVPVDLVDDPVRGSALAAARAPVTPPHPEYAENIDTDATTLLSVAAPAPGRALPPAPRTPVVAERPNWRRRMAISAAVSAAAAVAAIALATSSGVIGDTHPASPPSADAATPTSTADHRPPAGRSTPRTPTGVAPVTTGRTGTGTQTPAPGRPTSSGPTAARTTGGGSTGGNGTAGGSGNSSGGASGNGGGASGGGAGGPAPAPSAPGPTTGESGGSTPPAGGDTGGTPGTLVPRAPDVPGAVGGVVGGAGKAVCGVTAVVCH